MKTRLAYIPQIEARSSTWIAVVGHWHGSTQTDTILAASSLVNSVVCGAHARPMTRDVEKAGVAESADARDSKSRSADSQPLDLQALNDIAPPNRPENRPDSPPDDADLAAVIAAWPTLPDALKAGILAMVKQVTERA